MQKNIANHPECNRNTSPNNIMVCQNGTTAGFLSLLYLNQKSCQKLLIIGPIYFTYLHMAKYLNIEISNYNIDVFNPKSIDFNEIANYIKKEQINAVLMIDPYFGSGVSVQKSIYEKILTICKQFDSYLIIDYIYGNMKWKSKAYIFNQTLLSLVLSYDKLIMFESISKRLFLNGIKNAIIYASQEIIYELENIAEIVVGSLCYSQINLVNEIYNHNQQQKINSSIYSNLQFAINNYTILKSMLLNTNFKISNADSGYFALIAIPTKIKNPEEIILSRNNVLTLPHQRYKYNKPGYYCFRVNLTLDTHTLIISINKILNIDFDTF